MTPQDRDATLKLLMLTKKMFPESKVDAQSFSLDTAALDDLTYQQMKVNPARDSVENIVRRRSVPINTCMTPGDIMVGTTLAEED